METPGLSVFQVWWTIPGRLMWIYLLLVNLEVPGVMSDLCVYRRNKYNSVTGRSESLITTKECQWGCCYNNDAPCCTAPVSLIVGVVLGGVLIFSLILAAVCCCCVCRRNQGNIRRRSSGAQSRGGPSTNQESVVFRSETSGCVDTPNFLTYSDAPPSYDDVMRGETNDAYKPETS